MALLSLAVAAFVAYIASSVIYNLFFHPLAKTPGPILCRVSILPSFYHAVKGDRHVWIWRNHQIFGDTFRAAPNLVLFNSQRAFTDIYSARAKTKRSAFYRAWKRNARDLHTICCTEPDQHAKKRKALNLAFTEQSLKIAGPLMANHIDRWDELLFGDAAETWSPSRNMATWVDYLVFDIIGDLFFGENFKAKEPGENKLKHIPHLIMKNMKIGYIISKSSLLDLFVFFQPRGLHAVQARILHTDMKAHNSFMWNRIDKRIAAHEAGVQCDRPDMFHFLLNAVDPETNLPAYTDRQNLFAETRLLVLAGTDTSAGTICGLFFYLAHNARVLAKLTAEIRSTFASVEEIMLGPKLSKCQYLRACIDEALRISPPAPGELPREVLPGGTTIQGRFYPEGTIVGCAAWSMGLDETVYGDAGVYRPERWIPSLDGHTADEETRVRQLKRNFHPFLIGPGDCAGQNVAILELLLVCARTVWRMDIRLAPGDTTGEGRPELGWGQRNPNHYIVKDQYLCKKDGPVLQFKKRSDA
jgi:cytochrome P450